MQKKKDRKLACYCNIYYYIICIQRTILLMLKFYKEL